MTGDCLRREGCERDCLSVTVTLYFHGRSAEYKAGKVAANSDIAFARRVLHFQVAVPRPVRRKIAFLDCGGFAGTSPKEFLASVESA